MNINKLLQTMRSGWSPIVIIAVTTLAIIAISIYCLASSYSIIFQNLFYIPIIIACVYYTKRGFVFSVIIACLYFLLTLAFTRESLILLQALVRVLIFVLVAGIIAYLSLARKRVEELLRRQHDNLEGLVQERTAQLEEDITERKQAEEALRIKNLVFDASIAANSIVGLDGVITEANDAFQQMWGYPNKGEIIGKPIAHFLNDPNEAIAIITALNETGQWEGDYTAKRENGSTFIAHGLATVIRDENGRVIGYQSAVTDITERKRMEEMLREALAQANEGKRILDALMEHVPEGITIADAPDVRIRMVSRYGRELTGKSKEILEGITVDKHVQQWDIYSIDGVTPAKNEDLPLTRATQKGELVKDEEWVLGHQSGKRIPVLCNAGPIRDDAGNIIGGVIAWRDITERKQLEQAVEKARADFLFAVSHELKTPLHVMGAIQEMIESLPEEQQLAQFREYGDVWRRNMMRLRFIIENLVDSQRPAEMGLKLDKRPTNLMDLAQEIAGELEPVASARSVQLRFQGESLPLSSIDSNAVRRLIENLLTNAIKFSPLGGQVEIRLRTEGEMVCLDICDFGMGIDPQIKPFLFQPFYRSPEALKAGVQGTGLGLYVSKMIAEAHGGTIQLDSEPGKGTTVSVRLPIAG